MRGVRFSLKRLLASVALVAAGIIVFMRYVPWEQHYNHLLATISVSFLGFALVGAGVFCPFKRTIQGALIGLVLGIAVPAYFIASCVP